MLPSKAKPRPMRAATLALIAAFGHLFYPAAAIGSEAEDAYHLGERACQQVLDGDFDVLLGDSSYSTPVQGLARDPFLFCNCVGTEFMHNEPLQSFRIDMAGNEQETAAVFIEILTENLDTCVEYEAMALQYPGDTVGDYYGTALEPEECEEGCQDGPIWADEADQLQCEMAIDGSLTPPFVEPEETLNWIARSGVDAVDLCGCVAPTMEDRADEYATELEASGGDHDLYWLYMAEAMSECRRAIWNG